MKPHKISTHVAYSDNCYFHFFHPWSYLVEILWGFKKFIFKQVLKVSLFYLEKQKSFIPPTQKNSRPLSISKQKSFVYRPNFQWRFWSNSDILFRIFLTHAYRTHSYKQGFQKPTPGVATTIFLCPQRHYKNSWYRYTACQIKRFKAIWPLVLFCVWVT